MKDSKVVTRFAPSPTGFLHAGNYRTAVFAYLFAKKHGGEFIVRIEDTDRERSKKEYEDNIFEALSWLGLPYDKKFRQSEHAARHRTLLEELIAKDKAYISKEAPKNPADRDEVVRFRNPGGTVSLTDEIRGEITMDVSDLGDFVIAKSLDEPIFHFAVVADDADEGVTHVIRGEDHISNTPRQILIQRALGVPTPFYAHLPLILGADRSKLSKRRGAKAITEYRDAGVLSEAMRNYLSLLGWNPGDDREYFTREELVASFEISRVQKGSAIFDETKLFSVNQHWMRLLSDDEFILRGNLSASEHSLLRKVVPLLKERAHTFGQAREILAGELACIFTLPTLATNQLVAKEPSGAPASAGTRLAQIAKVISSGLEDPSSAESVKALVMPYADQNLKENGGRGAVLWPLRYALSGQEKSPDPFTLISILGKEESLSRIQKAIDILSQ